VLRGQTTPADPEPLLEIDAEMPFGIITPAPAEALATLEPSGPGSPEPVLLARRVEIEGARRVDPTRPHLRLRLRAGRSHVARHRATLREGSRCTAGAARRRRLPGPAGAVAGQGAPRAGGPRPAREQPSASASS